jgi:hypothetical protein
MLHDVEKTLHSVGTILHDASMPFHNCFASLRLCVNLARKGAKAQSH